MIEREKIYSALFDLVSEAAPFITKSRRLRHWADVNAGEQPALFMAESGATAKYGGRALPTTWILMVRLFVYAHSSDPYRSPSIILNPLLDAVEQALLPNPTTGIQNLGVQGVRHARIEGKIDTDEGILGDQAVAVMPVEILFEG